MCNLDLILPLVRKPGRYINNELGSHLKTEAETSCVIAFPDVYEVGMSSMGVRILYHQFHRAGLRVERVFSPWVDMEKRLKEHTIPLLSIESKTPLSEFDLVAFSLQYELNYTNALCMLELGGIPLRSADRKEDDPIVVAGGTSVYNPLPIFPFFDAFLIGDAEVIVPEIVPLIKDKSIDRSEKLKELGKLSGVLLSGAMEKRIAPVDRVFLKNLTGDTIPDPPILPFIEIIHDRLVIEVARGCTRGCRFCQAGIIYRPYRERNKNTVVEAVLRGLAKTGYNDSTLLSLSVLDHSEIEGIIADLRGSNVGVSLPSFRGDALYGDLALLLGSGGVTIAPEAGTERLRRIINKDLDEETMVNSAKRLKSYGFNHAKLYFMIGLPQESEEDILGIVKLVDMLKKDIPLKVSISPFVPRPHTPFQWERQNNIEELREKIDYLNKSIKGARVTYRDPEGSLLEGALSRGDERLAGVIERAYKLGARFDEWNEMFDLTMWLEAFNKEGVDPEDNLNERDTDKPLPWDIINTGVSKKWLIDERELSLRGEMRRDCRITGCNGCGICEGNVIPIEPMGVAEDIEYGRKIKSLDRSYTKIGYRIRYSKEDYLRYIGHLDTTNTLIRTLRRAKLPLVYSKGYKPRPKVAFSPPLPLGFTSNVEYLDVFLERPIPNLVNRIQDSAPRGLLINSIELIPSKSPSLASTLIHQRLWIECRVENIKDFLEKEVIEINGMNVRPAVLEIIGKDDGTEVLVKLGKIKPQKLFEALFNLTEEEVKLLKIKRIGWR